MSTKYFISSDIHSFFDVWMAALQQAGFSKYNTEHKIIVCGDLFDRGNQSRECFEFVSDMIQQDRLIYIRGNHEDLLFDACRQCGRTHIGSHHVSNGTIKTIGNLMNKTEYDILCSVYTSEEWNDFVEPVLRFIDNNAKDYYEVDDFIFVHGWVPTTADEEGHECVHENWREGDWKEARWSNGMEQAHFKLTVPDKTVVCGHWHTSWGHSRYHKDGSEWDLKDANFYPYIDKGIIALDACTAYTSMINVAVLNKEEGKWTIHTPQAK